MLTKSKKKHYISDDSEEEFNTNMDNKRTILRKIGNESDNDEDYYDSDNDLNYKQLLDNKSSKKKINCKNSNSNTSNINVNSNNSYANKKIDYLSKYKTSQEIDSGDIMIPDYLIKLLSSSSLSKANNIKLINENNLNSSKNISNLNTLINASISQGKKSIDSLIPKKYHVYKDSPIMNTEFSVYDRKKHCWIDLIFPLPSLSAENRDQVILLKNTISVMLDELSEQISEIIPELDSNEYMKFRLSKLQNNVNIVKRYIASRLFDPVKLKMNKFLEDKSFLSKSSMEFSGFLSKNEIYSLPSIDSIHAIRKEYGIYSSAIHEIGRQISGSCNERYDLLATLLDRMDILFEEALVFGLKDFKDTHDIFNAMLAEERKKEIEKFKLEKDAWDLEKSIYQEQIRNLLDIKLQSEIFKKEYESEYEMHLMYRKDAEDGRKARSDVLAQNTSLKSQISSYKSYLTGIKDDLEKKKEVCIQQEIMIETLKEENNKYIAQISKENVFHDSNIINLQSQIKIDSAIEYETLQSKVINEDSFNLDFSSKFVKTEIFGDSCFNKIDKSLPLSANLEFLEKSNSNSSINEEACIVNFADSIDVSKLEIFDDESENDPFSIKHPFCAYKNLKSICVSAFKGNFVVATKNNGQKDFFDYIEKTNSALLDNLHKINFLTKNTFKVMDDNTLYSFIWKLLGCKLESDVVSDFSNEERIDFASYFYDFMVFGYKESRNKVEDYSWAFIKSLWNKSNEFFPALFLSLIENDTSFPNFDILNICLALLSKSFLSPLGFDYCKVNSNNKLIWVCTNRAVAVTKDIFIQFNSKFIAQLLTKIEYYSSLIPDLPIMASYNKNPKRIEVTAWLSICIAFFIDIYSTRFEKLDKKFGKLMQIGPPVSPFEQYKLLVDSILEEPSTKFLRKSFCNILISSSKVIDPAIKKSRINEVNFLTEPRISIDGFSSVKKSIPYFRYDYRVSSNYLKSDIFVEKELTTNFEFLQSNWNLFVPRLSLIIDSISSVTNKSDHFLSIGAASCIAASMCYASSKVVDSTSLLGKPLSYISIAVDNMRLLKKKIDLEFTKSLYVINFRALMNNMHLSFLLSDSYQESEWELLISSVELKLDLGLKSLNCLKNENNNLPKLTLKSVIDNPKFK